MLFTDLTALQRPNEAMHNPAGARWRGDFVVRDPRAITSVTLHQTSCVYGVSPRQLRAANGDRALARRRRGLNVRAHAVAFRDAATGGVLVNHPLWLVNGANGLNPTTLNLEIECWVDGIEGVARTFPGTDRGTQRAPITDELLLVARTTLVELVTRARDAGCVNLRYVAAHRQSNPSRRADPGSRAWQELVLSYAVPVLGLETMPDAVWAMKAGLGRPIPEEWDPHQTERY